MSIINCQYKFDKHFFYANLNTNGQTQTNERKRIMSEIKDQEAEVKACEACAEEAESCQSCCQKEDRYDRALRDLGDRTDWCGVLLYLQKGYYGIHAPR